MTEQVRLTNANPSITMPRSKDLHGGFSHEKAEAIRKEAIDKYGLEAVEKSEKALAKLSREELEQLKQEAADINARLFLLLREDPYSKKVQELISLHYANIRKFWGTHDSDDCQGEAYVGLGQLYVYDERFTFRDGRPQPEFARFLHRAMAFFVHTRLN